MFLLLITYNLVNASEARYQALGGAIKALGETWHARETFDSVWWVYTESTPDEADSSIAPQFTVPGDTWYVVDVTGAPAQGQVHRQPDFWNWLRAHGGGGPA